MRQRFFIYKLEPTPKTLKKTRRHRGHRVLLISTINFVEVSDLVPYWQKKIFGLDTTIIFVEQKLKYSSRRLKAGAVRTLQTAPKVL
jgi:hypothetical protein